MAQSWSPAAEGQAPLEEDEEAACRGAPPGEQREAPAPGAPRADTPDPRPAPAPRSPPLTSVILDSFPGWRSPPAPQQQQRCAPGPRSNPQRWPGRLFVNSCHGFRERASRRRAPETGRRGERIRVGGDPAQRRAPAREAFPAYPYCPHQCTGTFSEGRRARINSTLRRQLRPFFFFPWKQVEGS